MGRFVTLMALVCVVCAAAGSLTVPPALAAQSQAVSDCNSHGRLTQRYSAAQLRTALSTMPADVKEYTDCYDVIQRALLAQIGGSHTGGAGGSGSGGSFLPTPLLVVLVLLALGAASFGAVAIRRRRSEGGSGSSGL